jgi:hypothetical protein
MDAVLPSSTARAGNSVSLGVLGESAGIDQHREQHPGVARLARSSRRWLVLATVSRCLGEHVWADPFREEPPRAFAVGSGGLDRPRGRRSGRKPIDQS